jgi:hypothetical protein
VGHFLLANGLLGKLKAQSSPSRVVVVASTAHTMAAFDLQDLNYDKRS